MRILVRLLLILLALAAVAIWWLSRDPFFVVGGSDATAVIIEPDRESQIAALALLVLGAAGCIALRRGRTLRRVSGLVLALGLLVFALATHRLVVDGGRGEIRDIWGLITLQRIAMSPQDGLGVDPLWAKDDYLVTFRRPTGETMTVFLGLGPLKLDTAPLEAFAR
jgi:hypothetical protein